MRIRNLNPLYLLFIAFFYSGDVFGTNGYTVVNNHTLRDQQGEKDKGKWMKMKRDMWRGAESEEFPLGGWVFSKNTVTVIPGKKGGDLVTREKYGDFELMLEFNFTPSANTGIMYFAELAPHPKTKKIRGLGLEYQIIDDFNYKGLKGNLYSKNSTGAVYDLYAPSKSKVLQPTGKWNKVKIISKGRHVEHWLNGKKIASYERGSEEYNNLVKASKFENIKNFGTMEEGYIVLQDYGDQVSFRNIKIRRL